MTSQRFGTDHRVEFQDMQMSVRRLQCVCEVYLVWWGLQLSICFDLMLRRGTSRCICSKIHNITADGGIEASDYILYCWMQTKPFASEDAVTWTLLAKQPTQSAGMEQSSWSLSGCFPPWCPGERCVYQEALTVWERDKKRSQTVSQRDSGMLIFDNFCMVVVLEFCLCKHLLQSLK